MFAAPLDQSRTTREGKDRRSSVGRNSQTTLIADQTGYVDNLASSSWIRSRRWFFSSDAASGFEHMPTDALTESPDSL